ncbi:ABC transporter substrate-binding protein [Burkholderia sp. Ac-20365]|uniref:ABC transporter substrate-binding protein n=1 Tax=Burkholderia sp. Ac-20365 TaxID=2703897 RepID=UPI00197BA562|nr:ABC transporter substrate-binding protein [Burkholderia sp. Ac-20365]MBN3761594.1 carbohydrate ABC transporter substrate-binding protein [Burkholderia sp. Ac-20365]
MACVSSVPFVVCRRLTPGAVFSAIFSILLPSAAIAASNELVIIDWLSGAEGDTIRAMESAFQKSHPTIKIREISLTVQGDARGAIRAALMSGEKADLLINTWPAFRAELVDAGMLRPLDTEWNEYRWSDNLDDEWKRLGQYKGVTYGVTYTFGDRSGIFYRTDVMKKAGIGTPPKTWGEFLGTFGKLRAVGVTPIAIAGKTWAHAEWFETMLLRVGGVEASSKLAAHKIAWTDPVVKMALQMYAEMLKANCCDDPNRMLATEWDNAADEVLKSGTHGYDMIGMWVNNRAKSDYGMKEGVDYALFQFPSMGFGHDDTTSVDTKEFLALKSGSNATAANQFMTWMTGAEAAAIEARNGLVSPSSKADNALLSPVATASSHAVKSSRTQFVLGDLLPGDLVDEYRVQLQHFLQDPSDANIDRVLAAVEAKAKDSYR